MLDGFRCYTVCNLVSRFESEVSAKGQESEIMTIFSVRAVY